MVGWLSNYADRLNRSFAAVNTLLERPKVARRSVLALLAIQSMLLAYSAYVHSPTLNEPGHLVAGLSYWKFGRFDVYNVNPPLVKLVAALPVMAAGYEEDWSGFYSGPGARPEFAMGEDFVAANGERAFFLFMIARWACIPFSWLGGIICYMWARDLYGRPAGVIACAIWCFEPNILAHASLMTPDAHATSLGLAACYTFWRWLKQPTWTQALVTGVVLGLAELAKTTLILFYPLWPLLWAAYRWRDRYSMVAADWLREAGMLATRMLIGLYVVNLGYGFEGTLEPLGEYEFVSNLFAGRLRTPLKAAKKPWTQENEEGNAQAPPSAIHASPQAAPHNRFADSWLGQLPMPFPKNFLMGIDIQQNDFEHYSHPSYLRGEWRDHGWWYYYLYAATIKVPLGLLILSGFGFAAAIMRFTFCLSRQGLGARHLPTLPAALRHPPTAFRGVLILLTPPIVIVIVVSSKTGFSEHFRYVLLCFPFVIVWISGIFRNLLDYQHGRAVNCTPLRRHTLRTLAASLALSALLWSSVSSLWIYPHSLSYFNEAIGGPFNGPGHLLGSNVDWNQDYSIALQQLSSASNDDLGIICYLNWAGVRECWNASLFGFRSPVSCRICGDSGIEATSCNETARQANSFLISVNMYHAFIRQSSGHLLSDSEVTFPASLTQDGTPYPVTYSIWLVRRGNDDGSAASKKH